MFKDEVWIISQIFSQPFIFIKDQFYCGGKRGNNKGGVNTDFLYQNKYTDNVAFIEIKTPKTKITGKPYRGNKNNDTDNNTDNNTVYSIHEELTGGINQVLNQRKMFLMKKNTLEENNRKVFNSKCILILGTLGHLSDGKKNLLIYLEIV
ncbi:MAG: DUF4263 domain-containing protein [Bacteroidetes bacterium]|nr:DUF4263 domain-containing protein [Bacteroidota bacterium]